MSKQEVLTPESLRHLAEKLSSVLRGVDSAAPMPYGREKWDIGRLAEAIEDLAGAVAATHGLKKVRVRPDDPYCHLERFVVPGEE